MPEKIFKSVVSYLIVGAIPVLAGALIYGTNTPPNWFMWAFAIPYAVVLGLVGAAGVVFLLGLIWRA